VRERLEPYDIGRALFHLSKHRAFRGSVKFDIFKPAEKEREKEEGKILGEIEGHRQRMAGRTVGEYLKQDFKFPDRKRRHHFQRDMVEEEFDRLWNKQREFHPELLTGELREKIRSIIFLQRPTFFRINTVGECELEPGQPRCLKADWYAQRFAMLQMLNSLRLSGDRPLTADQRATILGRVEGKAKVSFPGLRKSLGLQNEPFNFEIGGKKEMLGNATEQKLAHVLGDAWQSLPVRGKIRDQIADRLWHIEYRLVGKRRAEIRDWKDIAAERENFTRNAERDWKVTAEQGKALSELNLPDGHTMHSKRAILQMLPYLEKGLRYDEAKAKAYPEPPRPSAGKGRLPPPREVRNPTVMRTLNELRNVANNLLRVYGHPDLIRVELARDLKLPREKRRDKINEQKKNEARRDEAKKWLAERNIDGSGLNIEKYLLAEQQGWRCPYTGGTITCEGLFQTGLFQVDHVLPRSRSLDNSFGNKIVCHRDANDEKAKRTPHEAWGKDADRWAEVLRFVDDIGKSTQKNRLPFTRAKSERIRTEDYPAAGSEEFTNRQLVDNAYASRRAREYLAVLGVKVEPANGRVTRNLRHLWGLDQILSDENEKTRDDHRHHAIDALAVALTTPAFVKRASEYYGADIRPADEQLNERLKERVKRSFKEPWETIHSDAERAAGEIIVSHRAQRKVSGKLNEPNPWSDTGEETEKAGIRYRFYAQRNADRKLVRKRMQLPFMKAVGPDRSQWVRTNFTDAVHHMVVYEDPSGELKFKTVNKIETAERVRRKEPIVNRTPEPGVRNVRSLCKGDMLERTINGNKSYWVVKSVWSSGQVAIQPHSVAQDLEQTYPSTTKLFREGARKVVVDPIGRVFPAND
jgi:CRISPR-associated endonuclease Csn1